MKTIQIRAVPDDVHAALRAKAAIAGLSLSEYLLREAVRVARRPDVAEVLKRATDREWGVRPEEAAEALRSDRDGR
jgi:plasmid stability protein